MTTRQYREQVQPANMLEDMVMRLFYPQRALGKYVDEEMSESVWVVTYLIASFCTVLILGILLQSKIGNEKGEVSAMTSATMVLTAVLFASFIYVVFDATKLFHISILIALLATSGLGLKHMNEYTPDPEEEEINKTSKDMMLAIIILSAVSLAILSYYYIISRTVTDSTEIRERERRVRLDNKYKDKIERVRRDNDQVIRDYRQQYEIDQRELAEQTQRANNLEQRLSRYENIPATQ